MGGLENLKFTFHDTTLKLTINAKKINNFRINMFEKEKIYIYLQYFSYATLVSIIDVLEAKFFSDSIKGYFQRIFSAG